MLKMFIIILSLYFYDHAGFYGSFGYVVLTLQGDAI